MPGYLLGTEALIDFARRTDNPVWRWLRAIPVSRFQGAFHASVVSFGQWRSTIDNNRSIDAAIRHTWNTAYAALRREFVSPEGRLLGVDAETAEVWARLRELELEYLDPRSGTRGKLAQDDRLIVATALARDLVLVERHQPYHVKLSGLGLQVHDPYA